MATLNPKWLVAAVVKNTDGSRLGTVSSVRGDTLTVMCGKLGTKVMSAKELDSKGLIYKNIPTHSKYL